MVATLSSCYPKIIYPLLLMAIKLALICSYVFGLGTIHFFGRKMAVCQAKQVCNSQTL